MNTAVGRIIDLECHQPPPLMCSRCPILEERIRELEDAIREHKETKDMSRSFATDAVADSKLWEILP